ncbi:hypothetical protein J2W32_006531 [Variovorax boronicumulans]|uniref:Uncharacterized protein n=1 Tax=Variovorax boronicumulans TaxID=436515 RepID=A0AAW8DA14_9BURK|nr:hypothetical protein [Variovorax boronicumulans]MDP9897404.1 hypothetical protein [Variovorax boronicumulans]MDQ0057454.1 hypothetical protein [Variovorax boronicumulans]
MSYEPPLSGNPNNIAVDQHVFPQSAVARFKNSAGLVAMRLTSGKTLMLTPKNWRFCARRAWDQGTETFRTHQIETSYQVLANAVASGATKSLSQEMSDVVTSFYALWRARQAARAAPMPDAKVNGIEGEELTKEKEEWLEVERNTMFIRADTTVPSRFLTGIQMRRHMDAIELGLEGKRWGIVKSDAADFLVPDGPGELNVVPVTPAICLCVGIPDMVLDASEVGEINRQMVRWVHQYFFAQDLERCSIGP